MASFLEWFNTKGIPSADNAYDLGDSTHRFKDFYIAGNIIGGSEQIGGQNFSRSGIMFVQTADATVTNTTVETTLVGTVSGTATLSANVLAAGRTLRLTARGYMGAAGTVPLRLRVRYGGISGTILLDTTANQIQMPMTNRTWEVSGLITCRTTGASGTVYGQGFFSGPVLVDMRNTATTTIDTTAASVLLLSAEWGAGVSATDTITSTNMLMEVLN